MSDFKHARPVPPEWPGLIAYAECSVPADLPSRTSVNRRFVAPVLRQAMALSDEQRGANDYYALGEVMCRMAWLLREDTEARQRLVGSAARGMLRVALLRRADTIPFDKPFVPLIDDLPDDAVSAMQQPFFGLARTAQMLMPTPQSVLSDALSAAVLYRRREAQGRLGWLPFLRKRHFVRLAAGQGLAAARITDESLTGATGVMKILLTGNNPVREPSDEMLAMPLEAVAARRAWNPTAYTGSALLRLDEFLEGRGWQGVGESLHFDTSVLKVPPRPRSQSPKALQLHENRLGCPAVKANGLASYVARHVLPDIITTAQQLIPGEHFRIIEQSSDTRVY